MADTHKLTHYKCGHEFVVTEEVATRVRTDVNGGKSRTVRDYTRDQDGKPTGEFTEREVFDNPEIVCPSCGEAGPHKEFESLSMLDNGQVHCSNREKALGILTRGSEQSRTARIAALLKELQELGALG